MAGEIWWSELITSNVENARAHYEKIAGWTSEDIEMPDGGTYTIFSKGEQSVAGMQMKRAEWGPLPDHWMTYIAVKDVEVAIDDNARGGGQLLSGPIEIPLGRFAVLADPTGAKVAVATPA